MYDVVVIGGGVAGLSTAYHIAKEGASVCLLERSYMGSGSSTRNASGFRIHFKAEENVRFMLEGKKKLKSISRELGWNPLVFEDGYLWLVHDESTLKIFSEMNTVWCRHGVGVRFLDPHALKGMLPGADLSGVIQGVFGRQDGTFHHDAVLLGYQRAIHELDVEVQENSPVTGFEILGDGVVSAVCGNREFKAEKFVVACGAYTSNVLLLAGINLEIRAERRELGVTEPVRSFLRPFVFDLGRNVYCAQGLRGEVRGAVTDVKMDGLLPYASTYDWTKKLAERLTGLFPILGSVGLNRQWSGYYEVTKDSSHVMGRGRNWPSNIFVAAGFSGHGMMMGPLVGELMAKHVLDAQTPDIMRPYNPDRFADGHLIPESMIF